MPLYRAELVDRGFYWRKRRVHDKSLVLYLSFDKDDGSYARDRSGYNKHGVIYGASRVAGKVGNALSFDGVDDYANVEPFTVYGWNEYTFMSWISPNAIPSSGYRKTAMISRNLPSPVYWYGSWIELTYTNYLHLYGCRLWRPSDDAVYAIRVSYTLSDYVGKWVHVAYVVSKLLKRVRIYVGGALVNDTDISSYLAAGYITPMDDNQITRFTLGCNTSLSENAPIIHDEVRIYNRALSQAEIIRLMYMRGV